MSYFDKISKVEIKEYPIIMGIETSCDETAVAIIKNGREILADEIISSATEHARFGGVVPEIASRGHTTAISEAVDRALKSAGLTLEDIDAFAKFTFESQFQTISSGGAMRKEPPHVLISLSSSAIDRET